LNLILEGVSSVQQDTPRTFHCIVPGLARRFARASSLAQCDEFGVAEKAAFCRLGKFDFGFDFRAQPDVVGHFFGADAFAPVAGFWCREIGEWTFLCGQGLQEFEQRADVLADSVSVLREDRPIED
jgi:hypothetical protein